MQADDQLLIDVRRQTNLIPLDDLHRMLKEFGGPLEGVEVKAHVLAPYLAVVSGVCRLGSAPFGYEFDLDLRGIYTAKDVIRVVNLLLRNMAEAERQQKRR